MSNVLPISAITDNWSQGGTTFTGIGLNVTDAASAPDSALLDLKVGGDSKLKVGKGGTIAAAGGLTLGVDLAVADGGTGASTPAGARLALNVMQNLDAATAGAAPDNSNWNDFVAPGPIPRLMRAADASGNSPVAGQFFYGLVFVFGDNITQIAVPYQGEQSGLFRRSRFNGGWSAWRSVTSAADIGLGNVANKTEAQMVAAGAIADALATKQNTAAAAFGNSTSGSQNTVDIGASEQALAGADFTATGPACQAIVNCSVEGAADAFFFVRIDLFRIDSGALVKSGQPSAILHRASGLERNFSIIEFTGLARNAAYRFRAFGYTGGGVVKVSSNLIGFCA